VNEHTRAAGNPDTPAPITVIGIGDGPLDARAREALSRALLVVGGHRHLRTAAELIAPDTATVPLGSLRAAAGRIETEPGPVVVLASCDPGWFGPIRTLRRLGRPLRVLSAPPSLSGLAALAGLPWDDVATVSAHGRDPREAVNAARALPAVAVLTGPSLTVAELSRRLEGWNRHFTVAERLGHDDERLTRCAAVEAANRVWATPNVVLVTDPDRSTASTAPVHDQPAAPAPGGWALPESRYAHRNSMVTKAEVRALVVARLAPTLGRLVWDVGAGSGSVAVECGLLRAAAIAVEADEESTGRIRENAVGHGVDVRVVHGRAPEALTDLPGADAAFVGGGGPAVVAAVAARGVPRVVVACAVLDHALAARAALREAGYAVQGTQLSSARLAELPDGTVRLAALNPVTVLWADAADAPRSVPGSPQGCVPGGAQGRFRGGTRPEQERKCGT
jgi:precorrin-6B C5,15-methyltransferase / cobalt-precorrin-6B C5,C15-methyltransferase